MTPKGEQRPKTTEKEMGISSESMLTDERDREFYSQALHYLLGFEILLQTCVITILMILQMEPAVAIGVSAILFIAGRLAAQTCRSRLQRLNQYQQPIPVD